MDYKILNILFFLTYNDVYSENGNYYRIPYRIYIYIYIYIYENCYKSVKYL